MNNNNNSSGSSACVGFTGLLTIAFIVLKLCHVIEWSWFWVLSPMIFDVCILLLFILFVLGAKVWAKHL